MVDRRRKTLFITGLVIASILAGCTATKLAVMNYNEGAEMERRGEWDEAVLKYREAYNQDPGNIDYNIKYRRARFEASMVHYNRAMGHVDAGNPEAAQMELEAALILNPTFKKAQQEHKKTRNLIDSIYYYGKGLDMLKLGRIKDAKKSFKKSIYLNPENESAAEELEKLRNDAAFMLDGFDLNIASTKPITLEFRDVGIKQVFKVISKLSGINFVFDADLKDNKTTIYIKEATFKEVLDLILMTNKLSRKVVNSNTIVIYSTTPQKIKQYAEMMIKVFYLTNIEAKQTVNLLRTMIKAKDIYVLSDLNAIVVRAKPEALEVAEKILEATDLADAEVMLVVDILEITRNKAQSIGLDFQPDSLGVSLPTGDDGLLTLGVLDKLSPQDLLITLPTGIINFKMEYLDAETLANPRIRVKNNEKARVHIGERVPIITTTVNQGVSSESVQYQDVGIKLNVEPNIRPNDEIDLIIDLEVSTLGTKTVTANGSIVYQIGTRNTQTTLRLLDGETQIIGGLISDEERTTVIKIPGLGEIPIIGKLFSSTDKSTVKTDLLLSITPHIIRRVEIPSEDVLSFWSGREELPSIGGAPETLAPSFRPPVAARQQGDEPQPPPPPPGFFPTPESELLPLPSSGNQAPGGP